MEIEEFNRKELKLGNENTKPLRQIIRGKLQTANEETKGTYWTTRLNWDVVLEMDWMNQTKWGMNNVKTTKLPDWLRGYEQIFQSKETGLLERRKEVDHVIILKEQEPKSSFLISTKPKKQQFIKDYLDDLFHKRWIRLNKSFYRVFLFLIFKKKELRPIIDYRKLNEIIVTDSISLSLIDDIMNQIQENTIFSKIDLKNVFNQIRIRKENEWKTTFRTRYDTFEYLIMSFKLVNVLGIF